MYQCSKHGWVSKFEDCPKCSPPVKSISSTNTNQIETQTPDKKLTPMAAHIEWLKKERKKLYEFGYDVAADRISAAIDNATSLLPAEQQTPVELYTREQVEAAFDAGNGWVKVEDKLPEIENTPFSDSAYVLCLNIHMDSDCPFVAWYNYKGDKWTVSHHYATSEAAYVTHWRPLPPPPSK